MIFDPARYVDCFYYKFDKIDNKKYPDDRETELQRERGREREIHFISRYTNQLLEEFRVVFVKL